MQNLLDRAVVASRYVLVVFYLGLGVALAAYAFHFVGKVARFVATARAPASDTALLLDLLYLVDSALVASLVAMVALSSYDSLVSRLADAQGQSRFAWVSSLDPGDLKLKVGIAIIAISAIHLLQKFMNVDSIPDRELAWAVGIHGVFVASALGLGLLDRLQAAGKKARKEG
ncbi:TIGR00645 family protein [Roseococcus sp. DSY-14]|uniref:TIGR00645 family protein n=1 Tax=Roseococcus sp. DSY-14 TaxID=3369650 RepID=UPI00387ACB45